MHYFSDICGTRDSGSLVSLVFGDHALLVINSSAVEYETADWGIVPAFSSQTEVVSAIPSAADSDLANAEQIKGKVALIDRGVCTFAEKAERAVAAGAIGVIFANNDSEYGDRVMNPGGDGRKFSIPIVMISFNAAIAMKTQAMHVAVQWQCMQVGMTEADFSGAKLGPSGAMILAAWLNYKVQHTQTIIVVDTSRLIAL